MERERSRAAVAPAVCRGAASERDREIDREMSHSPNKSYAIICENSVRVLSRLYSLLYQVSLLGSAFKKTKSEERIERHMPMLPGLIRHLDKTVETLESEISHFTPRDNTQNTV